MKQFSCYFCETTVSRNSLLESFPMKLSVFAIASWPIVELSNFTIATGQESFG